MDADRCEVCDESPVSALALCKLDFFVELCQGCYLDAVAMGDVYPVDDDEGDLDPPPVMAPEHTDVTLCAGCRYELDSDGRHVVSDTVSSQCRHVSR